MLPVRVERDDRTRLPPQGELDAGLERRTLPAIDQAVIRFHRSA